MTAHVKTERDEKPRDMRRWTVRDTFGGKPRALHVCADEKRANDLRDALIQAGQQADVLAWVATK